MVGRDVEEGEAVSNVAGPRLFTGITALAVSAVCIGLLIFMLWPR